MLVTKIDDKLCILISIKALKTLFDFQIDFEKEKQYLFFGQSLRITSPLIFFEGVRKRKKC